MKNILVIFLILLAISGISLAQASKDDQTNWEKIDVNSYVDPDGITGTENFYGYSFLLKSYNKGQYEPVNNRQVFYTLGRYEINCLKHTYKIGIMDSYDEDGYFINGDYNKYAQFQPIVQGTAIEVLASRLCRI